MDSPPYNEIPKEATQQTDAGPRKGWLRSVVQAHDGMGHGALKRSQASFDVMTWQAPSWDMMLSPAQHGCRAIHYNQVGLLIEKLED